MLDALTISKFSPEYMSSFTKTINTKISKEELMKTIYALTPIKNDSIMKEKSVLSKSIINKEVRKDQFSKVPKES